MFVPIQLYGKVPFTPLEWRNILKLSIISPDYSISAKSVANSVKLRMR